MKRPSKVREAKELGGDVRSRLSASAVGLFSVQGYRGTSVEEIVASAGVTKGAFYHYFSGKDDLLREIHDTFLDFEIEQADLIRERQLPPDETLKLLMHSLLECVRRYPAEIRVFFQELPSVQGATFQAIKAKRSRFGESLVEAIEAGMAAGIFRRVGPPRVLAYGIIGMCSWAYHWFRPDGPVSTSEIAEAYAEVVLTGLREGTIGTIGAPGDRPQELDLRGRETMRVQDV